MYQVPQHPTADFNSHCDSTNQISSSSNFRLIERSTFTSVTRKEEITKTVGPIDCDSGMVASMSLDFAGTIQSFSDYQSEIQIPTEDILPSYIPKRPPPPIFSSTSKTTELQLTRDPGSPEKEEVWSISSTADSLPATRPISPLGAEGESAPNSNICCGVVDQDYPIKDNTSEK